MSSAHLVGCSGLPRDPALTSTDQRLWMEFRHEHEILYADLTHSLVSGGLSKLQEFLCSPTASLLRSHYSEPYTVTLLCGTREMAPTPECSAQVGGPRWGVLTSCLLRRPCGYREEPSQTTGRRRPHCIFVVCYAKSVLGPHSCLVP